MGMPMTNLEAQLPALFVESILYGLYLATFIACLQTLLQEDGQWKRFKDIKIVLLLIVIVLFIFSTLNLSCTLVQNLQGFVYHVGARLQELETSKEAENGIDQLGQSWLSITKLILLGLQTILADSVLVYRCWLVWTKSILAILIPLTCWLANVACCIYASYLQITLQKGSRLFMGELYWVIAAFWLCTILVNMYCTSMIVFKICQTQRAWRPPSIVSLSDLPQRGRLSFAKRIIIESGLIYTTTSIILFVTHLSRNNAVYIVTPAAIQVTGIAFNLILARTTDSERKQPFELPFYRQNIAMSRSTVDVAVMATTDPEDELDSSEEAYDFKPIAVNRLSR